MNYTCLAVILITLIQFCTSVNAASLNMGIGSTRINKPVKTLQAIKKENVVMQHYDYSCGAAALATLMTYYFNDEVSERAILDSVVGLDKKDPKQLKEKGLSLFEIKQLAEKRGYRAAGFRLSIDDLTKLTGPVLIYFEPRGYEHFAVLKGIRGNRVYLADPSRGNVRLSLKSFSEQWSGITLALEKQSNQQNLLQVPSVGNIQPEYLSIEKMMSVSQMLMSLPN